MNLDLLPDYIALVAAPVALLTGTIIGVLVWMIFHSEIKSGVKVTTGGLVRLNEVVFDWLMNIIFGKGGRHR